MGKLRRAEIDRCMLRVLHALAAAVAAGRDPAALARLAVDTARDLLAVDAASLYWWDAATAVLRCVAHTDPQRSAPARATRPAEDVAGQSLAQRAPVIVEDYPRWAHGHADPSAVGVRTAAAVPLLAGERALGVLLVHTYCPRHYAPSDLQLLAVLASQVGPTLEVARLDAEAKHRGAEAAALANLACQGAAECDPERVLSLITEAACSLLGADYAAVALTQPNGAVARYGIRGNRSQVWRDPVPAARPSGLTRRVLADGQPVLIEHLGTNTRFPPAEFPLHRSEGGRTVLGLPLRSREELLGALHLGWRTDVTLTAGQRRLAE